MNWEMTLQIAQISIAVLIIVLVSIQGKGAGLSSSIGSGALYSTRRGAERVIFYATVTLGVLFAVLSVVSLFM